MVNLRLLVLAFPVLLLGCGARQGRLDRRTRAVLAGATKVEVFRLDGESEMKPKVAGERRIGGFLVTAQGQDQGKELADKLTAILSDEQTCTDNYAKCFWPGVAFRVWKGEETVEVLICFKCDNLYHGPPKDAAVYNASFLGSPRRPDLLRLVKEAFPDDKEVQGLKDK